MEELANLTSLDLRGCSSVSDLTPLQNLTQLTSLNLSWCSSVSDLTLLQNLTQLTSLNLSWCSSVSDLTPLQNLTQLTSLNLSGCSSVSDLTPLQKLTQLTSLNLSGCSSVSDLTLLQNLTQLTSLDLSECSSVSDLTPLQKLTSLEALFLNGCCANEFRPVRSLLDTLTDLRVHGSQLPDLHPAVCGKREWDNALEPVRRYFAAVELGAMPDAELKVFVLGNGGAGKTKLVGRLMGHSFDLIREGSTHGIGLPGYDLPDDGGLPHRVRLAFWDFGGQDVYHGTHALFLHAPAIYVLLYSRDTENEDEFLDNGVPVKNRLLGYWFDYLRQVAGEDGTVNAPVLLVQSKCDTDADEDSHPPAVPEGGFPDFSKLIHISSKGRGRGLENLHEKLLEAAIRLLKACPQPPLPRSWADVRQALRVVQQDRSQQTISLDDLAALCAEHGCPDDEIVLRDALHEMGVVFYRPGVFDERIILDQSWALDAVYTVFTRDENFRRVVRQTNGRFTRDLLHRFFWAQHPVNDQRTFLDFMTSCNICFRVSGDACNDTAVYVAPDLLEPWGEREAGEFAWQQHLHAQAGVRVTFGLLHDGILRAFLSAIGRLAGDGARYWKFGCSVHDRAGSQAMIQTDGNSIHMRAWRGDALRLLQTLVAMLESLPLGRKPAIEWDGPLRPPLGRDGDFRLDPVALPYHKKLEDIGPWVRDYLQQLRMFYLIGSLFNDGAASVGEVGARLQAAKGDPSSQTGGGQGQYVVSATIRHLAKKWDVGTSKQTVSATIDQLAKKVFPDYFGVKVEKVDLLDSVTVGLPKVFNDHGRLAWQATCEFLRAQHELP